MARDTQLRAYLKERNIPLDSLEANSIIEGIEWADKHPSDKFHKEAIALAKEWLEHYLINYDDVNGREFVTDFEADMNKLWEEKPCSQPNMTQGEIEGEFDDEDEDDEMDS